MSKRFTDTEIWNDPWFRKLPLEGKVFWKFITDNCDNAGFWKKDFELVEFMIGVPISGAETPLKSINEGKERIRDHGEYLEVLDFVLFQFGELSDNNNFHRSINSLIERHKNKNKEMRGVDTPHEGPRNGKGMEKEIRGSVRGKFIPPTVEEVRAYCLERKNGVNAQKYCDFYTSKGWKVGNQPMKDWKAAVRTWEGDRKVESSPPKLCRACGKDASSDWVAVSGGVMHSECRDMPDNSARIRDMKAKSPIKTI